MMFKSSGPNFRREKQAKIPKKVITITYSCLEGSYLILAYLLTFAEPGKYLVPAEKVSGICFNFFVCFLEF